MLSVELRAAEPVSGIFYQHLVFRHFRAERCQQVAHDGGVDADVQRLLHGLLAQLRASSGKAEESCRVDEAEEGDGGQYFLLAEWRLPFQRCAGDGAQEVDGDGLYFQLAQCEGEFDTLLHALAHTDAQPGVWQGQAAGYAYGGSLYARTQVKNVQLISMTLPDINAGCGGIDAYLGSFSFINSEQLQRFVKQIMSNAAGYFFDLALQTTVPEIKTAKDFLQKMASDINSMNLSSCQAAQGIIGGLFPRTQVSQQKVCQDIAGESNIFADWAASRQGCTVGGKSDSVRDKASDKDKERVTKNINIMWNALSKNRMFDGNKELKEFVMTLTGSLVFGPNGEITPLSARTTDRSIIRAMMEGGTAKIYHCNDSDKCLKVVADTPVTISRDNALKSQITKLLASIQNKAVSDTPLDDKEKGFISSTTIPVFKYLVDPQMLGVSNSMIYQLTDYIGYDILLQYIQELIQQARAMVATGNYDEAVIEHINDNMNDATRQIAAFQSQVQVQQDALLVVDRQMSYMRQQLSARMLSRYQNNYHFGGSTL